MSYVDALMAQLEADGRALVDGKTYLRGDDDKWRLNGWPSESPWPLWALVATYRVERHPDITTSDAGHTSLAAQLEADKWAWCPRHVTFALCADGLWHRDGVLYAEPRTTAALITELDARRHPALLAGFHLTHTEGASDD